MNAFLPTRFDEEVHRLALGLEPLDAARQTRVPFALAVALENVPDGPAAGLPLPHLVRHEAGRYVLLYAPGLVPPVEFRIVDAGSRRGRRRNGGVSAPELRDARRYVPRRFRVALATEQQVLTGERTGNEVSLARRVRRPALFPGAAYDVSASATCLRGRVLRQQPPPAEPAPMRWARVEARTNGVLVGRAHGDDRGEFLLVLGIDSAHTGDLVVPLPVDVTVTGPTARPVPAAADLPRRDPLWDLPVEEVPPANVTDTVSSGEDPPPEYVPGVSVTRTVNLPLGRITSGIAPFVLPP